MVPESQESEQAGGGQGDLPPGNMDGALDALVRRLSGAGLALDLVLPGTDGGTKRYQVLPLGEPASAVTAAPRTPR